MHIRITEEEQKLALKLLVQNLNNKEKNYSKEPYSCFLWSHKQNVQLISQHI